VVKSSFYNISKWCETIYVDNKVTAYDEPVEMHYMVNIL